MQPKMHKEAIGYVRCFVKVFRSVKILKNNQLQTDELMCGTLIP